MKSIIVSIAVVVCLAFSSSLPAQSIFHAAATPAMLEKEGAMAVANWVDKTHDFGEITQGIPVNHTFSFTNTGNKDLKIESVKASCGCTATNYSKEAIAPGEQGFVTATYKASAQGVFAKSITIHTNADDPVTVLKLRGEVLKSTTK